ncbi:MAG: fructosamine kinase family protein [Gammaproteobacteria bacterium]|nr:fructosamine kinase family protein [Gammaproteobacteria bacterium]
MPDWASIAAELEDAGIDSRGQQPRPVSGGDISAAWRLQTAGGDIFLKTGPASSFEMFEAEAEGLAEIAGANAVRAPRVHAVGAVDDSAFVALEWLELGGRNDAAERRLGKQLAELHRTTKDRFGWHRGNTIGLTPQHNPWTDDWVAFFGEHRLRYQLRLAAEKGYGGKLQSAGARLRKRLPVFFDGYEPAASLLHGDLWGGNWGACGDEPVIFDPAVYFGDRETDIAMTRLFGGFGGAFYSAYEASWPLAPGHEQRLRLYQLYHVLNHLNLFGSAYLKQATQLIESLLRGH